MGENVKTFYTIREMPASERPRERLAAYGPEHLSNAELLAIILRVGSQGASAIDLGRTLISQFKSLRGIGAASLTELGKIKGLGFSKAVQIKAAMELGKRVALESLGENPQIDSPEDVYNLLCHRVKDEKQERFIVLLLDVKNRVFAQEDVTKGLLDASLAHAREVFKLAVREGAKSIIVAHNHPSGDPTPSKEDIETTKELKKAGETLDIPVLDHVIIGEGRYVSLHRQGLM